MEPASLDLIEIIEYASHDRPMAARKSGRNLLSAAKRLSSQPRQGKLVAELRDQAIAEYRQILVDSYRLIYSIRADSIDIVAVIDGRRDFQSALFQRLMR